MEGVPAESIMKERKEKIKFTYADQEGKIECPNAKQRIFQKSILKSFCFTENPARNALSPESFP